MIELVLEICLVVIFIQIILKGKIFSKLQIFLQKCE